MRIRVASLLAAIAGAGLLAYAVATGRADVGLLVLVPFVVGSGPLPLLGTLLVFAGLVGWTFSMATPTRRVQDPASADPSQGDDGDVRAGGVIMLGPIPIVLGTDRRTALLAALGGLLVLLGVIVYLLVR